MKEKKTDLLDYIFYCSLMFYARNGETPAIGTGVVFVSFCEAANLLIVLEILSVYTGNEKIDSKLVAISIFIIAFIYNFYKYTRQDRLNRIDKNYNEKTLKEKKKTGIIVLICILWSFISFITVSIYFGVVLHNK